MKASFPASTCKDGCKYLQGRLHVLAWRDAVHCVDGSSALRERLQCTASEMGKRGSEIVSPILDYYCPLNTFLCRIIRFLAKDKPPLKR